MNNHFKLINKCQREGTLEKLQDEVERALIQGNFNQNIPVLTYKENDLLSAIKTKTASGTGMVLVIKPPYIRENAEHSPVPAFQEIALDIEIIAALQVPQQPSIIFIMETVITQLHGKVLDGFDPNIPLELISGQRPVEITEDDDNRMRVVIHFVLDFHF